MRKYLNKPLRTILVVDFFVIVAVAMLAPIQAVFVQDIGGDILDAGVASSVFAFTAAIVVFIASQWSDKRKNKHKIVATGYILTGIGFLFYLAVDSVTSLLLVQVWIGISQAFMAPAFDGLYTDQLGSKKHATSRWGVWETENYLGIAIGGLFGSAVAKYFGFDALFITMSALALASGLFLFSRPRRLFR